jgi:hypothetical protein
VTPSSNFPRAPIKHNLFHSPLHRALFRHLLAAFVAVGLITAAYSTLGFSLYRDALLGNQAPPGELLRSSFIFAVGATVLFFLPAATLFEWRRTPAWAAPLLLVPILTLLWSLLHVINRTFAGPPTVIESAIVGIALAITFCAYWIPLRFISRRLAPLNNVTDSPQKAE